MVATLNKKALVVRDNHLIHAHFKMTAREIKLFLWLVSQIRKDDDDFQKYRVKIEVLRELLGLEGRSIYSDAADITRSLISRVAEIYDPERDRLQQRAMVIGADHVYGGGYVELQLHPDLRGYVFEIRKNFTSIELEVAMRLPTFYSIRIYEIAKSERHKGRVFKVPVDVLRKELGIAPRSYPVFQDFAKRVLKPACEEISKRTDIKLTFSTKRHGRKIGFIVFEMSDGQGSDVAFLPGTMRDHWLQGLEKHDMPRKEATKVIDLYGDSDPERIVWHLAELKKKIANGTVAVPLRWLRAGLKNDYRPQKSIKFADGKTVAQSDREERQQDQNKRDKAKTRSMKSGSEDAGMAHIATNLNPKLAQALAKEDDSASRQGN